MSRTEFGNRSIVLPTRKAGFKKPGTAINVREFLQTMEFRSKKTASGILLTDLLIRKRVTEVKIPRSQTDACFAKLEKIKSKAHSNIDEPWFGPGKRNTRQNPNNEVTFR